MAKYNISFNNTNYSVDESSLSAATAELRTHLSTTMSGSGAVINLGGTAYNVDSAKLTTATNDFISHLGKISGSGHKVVVGGVEYGIDSTKLTSAISDIEAILAGTGEERLEGDGAEFYTMAPTALSFRSTAPLNELQEIQINGVTVDPSNYTLEEGSTIATFPIDYLKTLDIGSYEVAVVSDSKTVKGDFMVKAPQLNEHGFYYNQPYAAYVAYPFASDVAFVINENGTVDVMIIGGGTENCAYTITGNNITVTSTSGTFNCSISSDGSEIYCTELAVAFKVGEESMASDEDYLYIYDGSLGGYEVHALDKTKAEYGAIKTGVNGIDTVKLADYMFYEVNSDGNTNLITIPKIPSSISSISDSAFRKCINLTNVTIPDTVTSISNHAFYECNNLTSVTIPNSVTSIGSFAFADCTSLNSITFEGTMAQWNAITFDSGLEGRFHWNANVPATYVQCSDGTVAL